MERQEMLRKLWWAVSMGLAAAWFASLFWIVISGPGPEMEHREKVMFAILLVGAVFGSANPEKPEFRQQLKGALGALMAIAGLAGMIYGIVLMLPSIAYKTTVSDPANLLTGLLLVASAAIGVIGQGLWEEYGDQSPSDPQPCPE